MEENDCYRIELNAISIHTPGVIKRSFDWIESACTVKDLVLTELLHNHISSDFVKNYQSLPVRTYYD